MMTCNVRIDDHSAAMEILCPGSARFGLMIRNFRSCRNALVIRKAVAPTADSLQLQSSSGEILGGVDYKDQPYGKFSGLTILQHTAEVERELWRQEIQELYDSLPMREEYSGQRCLLQRILQRFPSYTQMGVCAVDDAPILVPTARKTDHV